MTSTPPLPLWPDDAYASIADRVGRACYGLLFSERRWVHRRVETIAVLSREEAHRSVSVDLTVPEVFRNELALPSNARWLVPIATLRKHPLRNFDLRDESGRAVPLLERRNNGLVAHHALVTAARLPLNREADEEPSAALCDQLAEVVEGSDEEAVDVVTAMVNDAAEGSDEHKIVLNDDRFVFLLLDLMENYILLGEIDDVANRRILKFAYDHDLERGPKRPSLWERLGWQPLVLETVTPASAGSASYHAEVEIPEELRIDASVILDEQTRVIYAQDGAADRASLYASDVPAGAEPVLLCAVRAQRSGLPITSFAVASVLAALLGFGALAGDLSSSVAGPPIAVLLSASAVFAGIVARSGEHQLVQTLFALPRILLVVSAIGALSSAAALAFAICEGAIDAVWNVSAIIAFAVSGILAVSLVRAAPTTRDTG